MIKWESINCNCKFCQPRIHSLGYGMADFNYFLLENVLSRMIYCLIRSILHVTDSIKNDV